MALRRRLRWPSGTGAGDRGQPDHRPGDCLFGLGGTAALAQLAGDPAQAKNESTLVVIMAAGAVFTRTASKRTAVVVEDPRENGTARIRPAAFSPDKGWRRSVISPV